MEGPKSCLKKILFAFDFDHTILSANSDHIILNLLSKKSMKKLESLREESSNWAFHMQEVYKMMKNENVSIEEVKSIVQNIPFNSGFKELFELIQSNRDKIDTLIISGANTLFLQWVLEKNNLLDLFPIYYSNWAQPDEELMIKILPHHTHDCNNCDDSQCKRIILNQHLDKFNCDYSTMLFAGDGENDFCAGKVLKQGDILFPRAKFPLENKIFKKGYIKDLKCEILVWKDAYEMILELNKLLKQYS